MKLTKLLLFLRHFFEGSV